MPTGLPGLLARQEERLKAEQPEVYARFAEHEAKQRAFLERSKLTARSLAMFQAEEQRLTRLRLFLAGEPEVGVLDLWGWDERYNPKPSPNMASEDACRPWLTLEGG